MSHQFPNNPNDDAESKSTGESPATNHTEQSELLSESQEKIFEPDQNSPKVGFLDTNKDSKPLPVSDSRLSGKVDFSFEPGHRPFKLVKSEFLNKEIDKPFKEVKLLVDSFLKSTPLADDVRLSQVEKEYLKHSRDALAKTQSASQAWSQAMHLSRLYQHLKFTKEAKHATELSLGIDPENQTARELFKELERVHPVDIGLKPQATIQAALSKSNLRKRINALSQGKVIVFGDLLIDELLEGKPERISREAPVLILEHVDTELIPGGAANTAHNIASLGGTCHAIGVCGQDRYAEEMANLFNKLRINHSLVQDATRPTTVKTRILSKAHAFRQQLLRLDRISHEPISKEIETQLIAGLKQVGGQYKAIILSDYKGGVITEEVIETCRSVAKENNLIVIVDAQDRFERFQNMTLLTPNQPDTEAATGIRIDSNQSMEKAGAKMLQLTGAQALLITRGAEGMVLIEKGQEPFALPAFNKSEVFDVSGAGDTVAATMALALVTGSSFIEAMALGNLAASIVVRKSGTAVTNQKELLENLELVSLGE